jgi:Na+-translocating ferredoxin:NAD+ oxidoreductase RnfA subunit
LFIAGKKTQAGLDLRRAIMSRAGNGATSAAMLSARIKEQLEAADVPRGFSGG